MAEPPARPPQHATQLEGSDSRGRDLVETALVFLVFFVQGAWPVPDVNEPYYLGKAIHYWNPEWAAGDFFLESPDAHQVFYFTVGWLSLLLSPWVFAWAARLAAWGLLAWSWRRLSAAVLPGYGWAVLSAALLVGLMERCHMAGEWVVGGVEGKSFAYAFVLLALEALVRARWNRCFLLLGIASSLHVLVGGWSVLAAAVAWWASAPQRPKLRTILPGLGAGAVLALPGLLPVLLLDVGADRAMLRAAHEIYVYIRLPHHLVISLIPWHFIFRFAVLTAFWAVLWRYTKDRLGERCARLNWFVFAAVGIALTGALLTPLEFMDRALSAALLRFYWYRLSDFAVPMGVALVGLSAIAELGRRRPAAARWCLAAAVAAAVLHVGAHAVHRPFPQPPPAFRMSRRPHMLTHHRNDFLAWRDVCEFVAASPDVEPDAVFLTDRMAQTFKWYSGRPEAGNWKEIPQDAEGLVQWWHRMKHLHARPDAAPGEFWYGALAQQPPDRLRHLGKRYGARYVITFARPSLPLPVEYRNRVYAVYRLDE